MVVITFVSSCVCLILFLFNSVTLGADSKQLIARAVVPGQPVAHP